MIEVIKPGLETSIQDWPGRLGYANQGFPASGPMDSWSFRLANLLVGNPVGAAGFECQFIGPTLAFHNDAVIAITGADLQATLDDVSVPLWETITVTAGQQLTMSFAKFGARAYLAVSGGIAIELCLGSRSTFHKAGIGGIEGQAIKEGALIPIGEGNGKSGRRIKLDSRPTFSTNHRWSIEAVPGPNDDWIDEAGHQQFLTADWTLTGQSDRTGFRLDGPDWSFTEKAYKKPKEHVSDPSNIIDQGYPCGAINLAGQTPIILVSDGPSMGGFINPYVVPQAAFWKLAQSSPGDIYNFKSISVEEAQTLAHEIHLVCNEASVE